MADGNAPERIDIGAGHELSDLSPKGISLFAVALLALMIVTLLACYGMLIWFGRGAARYAAAPSPMAAAPEPALGPRLEVEPGRALKAMREREEKQLHSYGWLDQEEGIVHIPIERAMELLADKGLPARQPQKPGASERVAPRRQEPRS